jgi:hypothetical protein
LSMGLFEKTPVFQALSQQIDPNASEPSHKQLALFDF